MRWQIWDSVDGVYAHKDVVADGKPMTVRIRVGDESNVAHDWVSTYARMYLVPAVPQKVLRIFMSPAGPVAILPMHWQPPFGTGPCNVPVHLDHLATPAAKAKR